MTAMAFTPLLVLNETSTCFPKNECIQGVMATLRKPKEVAERAGWNDNPYTQTLADAALRGREPAIPERNAWSKKAITILQQKGQSQELKEYKLWLLLIASTVMEQEKSHGFLGLRKNASKVELAQTVLDFALVLLLAE
jgi:hypothetical protein